MRLHRFVYAQPKPRGGITRTLLGVLVLLSLASLLCAEEQSLISISFTALSLDDPIDGLYYTSGAENRKLFVPNASRSHVQKYSGPAQMSFYRGQPATGAVPQAALASLDLSAYNGRELLLVFAKDSANTGQYKVYAIDDHLERFPGDSWKVLNLTPSQLALKLGEGGPQMISAGGQHVFMPKSGDQPSETVQIAIRYNDDWKLAYNTIWGRKPQLRNLVFILPGARETTVRVHQIRQSVVR